MHSIHQTSPSKQGVISSPKIVMYLVQIRLYAGLCKTYQTKFAEICSQGVARAQEGLVKFRSGSEPRVGPAESVLQFC